VRERRSTNYPQPGLEVILLATGQKLGERFQDTTHWRFSIGKVGQERPPSQIRKVKYWGTGSETRVGLLAQMGGRIKDAVGAISLE